MFIFSYLLLILFQIPSYPPPPNRLSLPATLIWVRIWGWESLPFASVKKYHLSHDVNVWSRCHGLAVCANLRFILVTFQDILFFKKDNMFAGTTLLCLSSSSSSSFCTVLPEKFGCRDLPTCSVSVHTVHSRLPESTPSLYVIHLSVSSSQHSSFCPYVCKEQSHENKPRQLNLVICVRRRHRLYG